MSKRRRGEFCRTFFEWRPSCDCHVAVPEQEAHQERDSPGVCRGSVATVRVETAPQGSSSLLSSNDDHGNSSPTCLHGLELNELSSGHPLSASQGVSGHGGQINTAAGAVAITIWSRQSTIWSRQSTTSRHETSTEVGSPAVATVEASPAKDILFYLGYFLVGLARFRPRRR